jgi:streptogramin lyase
MDTQRNQDNAIVTSAGARPMKVFVDSHGNEWLCDKNVSTEKDFASQGCWRTDMMAFGRND